MIFPQMQINIENIQTTDSNTLGKSFLFDFEKDDFILKDGKLVEATELESIRIWVEKVIRTEKFKFKIYEKEDKKLEYGVTIRDLLLGQKYNKGFVFSELKREITEALNKHPQIKDIENFKIEREGASTIISFKVNLKSGISTEMEVIIDG